MQHIGPAWNRTHTFFKFFGAGITRDGARGENQLSRFNDIQGILWPSTIGNNVVFGAPQAMACCPGVDRDLAAGQNGLRGTLCLVLTRVLGVTDRLCLKARRAI
jgi:hypothetical protein